MFAAMNNDQVGVLIVLCVVVIIVALSGVLKGFFSVCCYILLSVGEGRILAV